MTDRDARKTVVTSGVISVASDPKRGSLDDGMPSTTPAMITGDTVVGPAPRAPTPLTPPPMPAFPLPEGPVTEPVPPRPQTPHPPPMGPAAQVRVHPRRRAPLVSSGNLIVAAVALAVLAVLAVLVVRTTADRGASLGPTPSVPTVEPAVPAGPPAATAEVPPAAATPSAAAAPAVDSIDPCPAGMLLVGGGKFFMGTDDPDPFFASSRPAQQLEVEPFCIGVNEVTVGEYRECSGVGECKRAFKDSDWPRPESMTEEVWQNEREAYGALCNERSETRLDHPVNCVTWEQAQSYCAFKGWRLPREAEWEFAARGSDGREFSWGDDPPSALTMNGCGAECRQWRSDAGLVPGPALHEASDGFAGTAPVGSYPAGASAHGLNDMAGNVWEWVEEPFAGSEVDEADEGRPRVIRGGGFDSTAPQHAMPAVRWGQEASAHGHAVGFRCAADPR